MLIEPGDFESFLRLACLRIVLEIRWCKKWVERRKINSISSGNRKLRLPVSKKPNLHCWKIMQIEVEWFKL